MRRSRLSPPLFPRRRSFLGEARREVRVDEAPQGDHLLPPVFFVAERAHLQRDVPVAVGLAEPREVAPLSRRRPRRAQRAERRGLVLVEVQPLKRLRGEALLRALERVRGVDRGGAARGRTSGMNSGGAGASRAASSSSSRGRRRHRRAASVVVEVPRERLHRAREGVDELRGGAHDVRHVDREHGATREDRAGGGVARGGAGPDPGDASSAAAVEGSAAACPASAASRSWPMT